MKPMGTRFLIQHQPGQPGQLPFMLALPEDAGAHTPLLVSVHGVTRKPLDHARAFLRPALAAGLALLVPLFSVERHRRYQQLVHPRSGRRADQALIDTVAGVREQHGLGCHALYLFGYSAGAQFAHRFAMAHPQHVAALGLGAPGWYTWPDAALPYPLGWAGMAPSLGLPALDTTAFLALPKRVWVGARDNGPDAALRSSPALDRLQGAHRLERAQRWAQAVTAAAQWQQLNQPVQVHTLPRAGHDFAECNRRGGLAQQVVDFFTRPPRPRPCAPEAARGCSHLALAP